MSTPTVAQSQAYREYLRLHVFVARAFGWECAATCWRENAGLIVTGRLMGFTPEPNLASETIRLSFARTLEELAK